MILIYLEAGQPLSAFAAHMSGMNSYDAGKHPRGQVGNAGQFRNKSWSDPEVGLVATTEQAADNLKTAREALAQYDRIEYWEGTNANSVGARRGVAEALRALVEPPATVQSPEEIAQRIVESNLLSFYPNSPLNPSEQKALLAEAVRAGIQSADAVSKAQDGPGAPVGGLRTDQVVLHYVCDEHDSPIRAEQPLADIEVAGTLICPECGADMALEASVGVRSVPSDPETIAASKAQDGYPALVEWARTARGFMRSDKSNDWGEEVAALDAILESDD